MKHTDVTVGVCSHNNNIALKAIASFKKLNPISLAGVLICNTGDGEHDITFPHFEAQYGKESSFFRIIKDENIKSHGDGINFLIKNCQAKYLLLIDSDVLFINKIDEMLDAAKGGNFVITGSYQGDCGEIGKNLWPRINPWCCLIDAGYVKSNNIEYHNSQVLKNGLLEDKKYDVGSHLLRQISTEQILIFDTNTIVKHYSGMSWHVGKFSNKTPNSGGIDLPDGTHNEQSLVAHGISVISKYTQESACYDHVDHEAIWEKCKKFGIQQKKEEYLGLLRKIGRCDHILEIGCYTGGSTIGFLEIAKHVTTITLEHFPQHGDILRSYNNWRLIVANSRNPEVMPRIKGVMYDLVFIDGDHTHEGSLLDYKDYGILGNAVAFHDIIASEGHAAQKCFVSKTWQSITGDKIELQDGEYDWGGIGLVFN